ncbi:MAG: NADH-quinone oxidoreductase subunit N [Candidatus Schekmanbacteria bacterium]|nr:NADH-quinone oxidoreductase subunit N [Candidatus Schekmanbacteria bacterium]
MNLLDFIAILPEIILALTGIIVLMVEVFIPHNRGNVGAAIGLIGLAAATLACFPLNENLIVFSGTYVSDYYSFFFKVILFVIVALAITISINYLNLLDINQGEFYALLLFSTLGLVIMVAGLDLIVIYLGLEMTALSSCALVGFMVKDKKSNEAALKYFLLNIFASGILLYGISWLYGITGKLGLLEIADYLHNYADLDNPGLQLALLLLIVGFGFKLTYVPFHMWVPDVYEGAPTSIAAFLSLGPKAGGMAVLLRLFMNALQPLTPIWTGIFALLSVITMTMGNIIALRQNNLKRMLGYSGIAHMGYMLMAASTLSKAPEMGTTAILLYLLTYIFMNLGPFAVIILLCREKRVGDQLDDFKGLARHSPMAAIAMTIFLLSLAGIPPTGGFIAKFMIFATVMKAQVYWLAVIGVINCAIAVFYYLRVVAAMYMEEPDSKMQLVFSTSLITALGVMACLALLTGLWPSLFIRFAKQSVGVLM